MTLLPLYLRYEPTTDYLVQSYPRLRSKRDVVAYRDPECTQRRARWLWYTAKPKRRNKTVQFNCHKWRAVWVPEHKEA